MEFPITTKFHIPYVSFFMLLSFATTILNPVFAGEHCNFPAIFNFGASNSDTGGFTASLGALNPPYGETYFHRPAGRYSDGRIILDFIAQSFGLPYLSPYLDSLGANFSTGANFATAGSTIKLQSSYAVGRFFSPFSIDVQYYQFTNFIPKTQLIRHQGGMFATLMPLKEYFSNALYTFDIGQNDITASIASKMTLQQVNASIPDIVKKFSANIKSIHDLGARSFWIHNTGPLGCHSSFLASFLSAKKDGYGCAKALNEVCQYFNQQLKEALAQLRKDLPDAAITYVDIYSAKYSLFQDPKKYGFEQPHAACCGIGGKLYNYNLMVRCGESMNINGTKISAGSCGNPSVRIMWDGTHYTEAANKVVFDKISSGAFTDPPVPLNMACRRSFT